MIQTQSVCTLCNISYKSENYRKLQAYSIHSVQLISECRLIKMLSIYSGFIVHIHQFYNT